MGFAGAGTFPDVDVHVHAGRGGVRRRAVGRWRRSAATGPGGAVYGQEAPQPIVPGTQAQLLDNGLAAAPADAPPRRAAGHLEGEPHHRQAVPLRRRPRPLRGRAATTAPAP